jgi:hypothetical protein
MSRGPEFEDLVGQDVSGEERERLRRTHELLVAAGPPPELTPELAAGPTLRMTLQRRSRPQRRRVYMLAAAVAAALVAFLGGYIAGNGSNGSKVAAVRTLQLQGTAAAPRAFASLRVLPFNAGNWPMTLSVTGLPALPKNTYYEVYLVRSGRAWASCGSFVVTSPSSATTVTLNAPYRLHEGDSWVVTKQAPDSKAPGPTVLAPVT